MTLPKAMLLDLDDTILAYDAVAEPTWLRVCAQYASEVGVSSAEGLWTVTRESRQRFWSDPERSVSGRRDLNKASQEVVAHALRRIGVEDHLLVLRIVDVYRKLRDEAIEPIAGAIESLEFVKSAGVQLVLVTNGTSFGQRAKLQRFRLHRFFQHLVIEEEFGFGKPDHRVFDYALRQVGVQPQDSWMVGDNLSLDILPAQQLGIYGVWVDASGRGIPSGLHVKTEEPVEPDRVVSSLRDLIRPE